MEFNKVICISCIEYMKTLEIGKDGFEGFNLIIADPPYFITKEEWDVQWKTEKEYLAWCEQWIYECARVLKPKGTMFIWGVFPMIDEITVMARKYLNALQEVIWYKPNGTPLGGQNYFRKLIENCKCFTKGKDHIFNGDDVREPYPD